MNAGKNLSYLLAASFGLLGVFFLFVGIWNLADALSASAAITYSVIALVFLALFALVSLTYGFFLFTNAKANPQTPQAQNIFARVSPAYVIGLLAYAIAPLFYIYISTDMRQLNNRRESAFHDLRPAFLKYVEDHGHNPRSLDLLVPDYLPEIPNVLKPEDEGDPDKRVQYRTSKTTARFYYKTGGKPNSDTYYDILKNSFRHKE